MQTVLAVPPRRGPRLPPFRLMLNIGRRLPSCMALVCLLCAKALVCFHFWDLPPPKTGAKQKVSMTICGGRAGLGLQGRV